MLQGDDVDDDYFTPVSNATLANIFGSSSAFEEGTQNQSLKYTPTKLQTVSLQPEVGSKPKATECIYACALLGYEWYNNIYSAKGKLGFAIVQTPQNNGHSIILYDSNKTALSNTTVTPQLEVTVKENNYMSYYDNLNKYWSVYATNEEIQKIVDLLQKMNVDVKYSLHNDKGPPEPKDESQKPTNKKPKPDEEQKESDTDSSRNKRTKVSIINRMAGMGHSVLPTNTMTAERERTSDSSDTNTSSYPKIRHKPKPSIVKRINTDRLALEAHCSVETAAKTMAKTEESGDPLPMYTFVNGQLVPVTNSNIIFNSKSDHGADVSSYYITEQRMSNSELKINVNRITDKVDQVLDKINDLRHSDKNSFGTSNFQNEILQKLLTEYENKIKNYEDILQLKNIDRNINKSDASRDVLPEIDFYKNKTEALEKVVLDRTNEISKLNLEIKDLRAQLNVLTSKLTEEHILRGEIENLKEVLSCKNDMNIVTKQLDKSVLTDVGDTDIESKVKNIMNETFKALTENFENDDNYSGETIKAVIAKVIKKVTLESFNR